MLKHRAGEQGERIGLKSQLAEAALGGLLKVAPTTAEGFAW